MKRPVNFARFAVRQPKNWVAGLALALLVCPLAGGCGKSSSSTPTAQQAAPDANSVTVSATPPPAPAPMPTAQPQATTNSTSLTTLQILNRQLVGWMIRNRRHPKDFEEFAGTANVQIPSPPAGKKYTLDDRGFIILVDNSNQ